MIEGVGGVFIGSRLASSTQGARGKAAGRGAATLTRTAPFAIESRTLGFVTSANPVPSLMQAFGWPLTFRRFGGAQSEQGQARHSFCGPFFLGRLSGAVVRTHDDAECTGFPVSCQRTLSDVVYSTPQRLPGQLLCGGSDIVRHAEAKGAARKREQHRGSQQATLLQHP